MWLASDSNRNDGDSDSSHGDDEGDMESEDEDEEPLNATRRLRTRSTRDVRTTSGSILFVSLSPHPIVCYFAGCATEGAHYTAQTLPAGCQQGRYWLITFFQVEERVMP